MKMYLFITLLFSSWALGLSQNTLGTIYNSEDALDGYTFFSPFSGTKAYMVDNCGKLVNEWDRGTRPGLAAYFLESGLILRTYKVSPLGPFTSASNAGGIELVDWDNNTVWSYEINTPNQLSHHDVVQMPNGNLLVLTWELISAEDLIALGRDPNEISSMGFAWNEKIIEIKPVGNNEIELLWEWRMRDHYIQDFDPSKENYGVVADYPERFDINLPDINGSDSHAYADYNHFNAIDYNADLDQILISVRNSDELWVLDHSTTTSEAGTSAGGRSGMGGDILYRWGNPNAYDRGEVNDQKLYGQHGANWIQDPITNKHRILVFNNGNGRIGTDYSTGEIIDPPYSELEGYIIGSNEAFGPESPSWIYGNDPEDQKLSRFLSNVQLLENGNFLMNYGSLGECIEVAQDGTQVWNYIIPLSGDTPGRQGQRPTNNATFRAYKFGKGFSGFDNLDVAGDATIELGTDLNECEIFTPTNDVQSPPIEIFYTNGSLHLTNFDVINNYQVKVTDIRGNQVYTSRLHSKTIELPNLLSGIYFAYLYTTSIHSNTAFKFIVVK